MYACLISSAERAFIAQGLAGGSNSAMHRIFAEMLWRVCSQQMFLGSPDALLLYIFFP
jgi:hypothetical protein